MKRFRELWLADGGGRRDLSETAAGLGLNPAAFGDLKKVGVPSDRPEIRALSEITSREARLRAFVEDDSGSQPAYRAWRERQKARSAFAFGPALVLGHVPFAFELTKGCSLGCWFCGLSAVPLETVLPTDLDAWRGLLDALYEVFGPSGARGFLYWATDPLDHPDYEAHAAVFQSVFGRFPATATAAAHLDLDRTRALMAQAGAGDCPSLRLSVVSLGHLAQLHEAFTPEELADVDLLPVNRESRLGLAKAGRARNRTGERWEARLEQEQDKLTVKDREVRIEHTSIACVAGFLIEPVEGRVRLISAEPSSDHRPDGFAVFEERRYEDAAGFRAAIRELVAEHMGPEPPETLAAHRGVDVREVAPGMVVAKAHDHQITFRADSRPLGHLPELNHAFRGGAAVDAVTRAVADRHGLRPEIVQGDVKDLWRQGVLIETVFERADDPARSASGASPAA